MQKASDIINTAFEIIMLQYFPAQLFFHKYTNIEYKSTYKALEYQALQNNNIFYDFYKQKIDEHNIKNYDLICISCPNQTQILPSMILARMIKEQSNAKIVLGGNIVSRIDKNLQKIDKIFNSFFDFIISGCGEKSLIKLAEHIFYKKGNLNNIKGLLYKNKNQIKLNKPDKNYNINNYLTPEIIMPIQLSKGCYWGKCTFCGLHYPPKKFTIKNPEKVVDEIEFLVKNHNIKTFEFIDEAIPPLYFSKLADIIIKRNIDIKYICCSRIEHKHYSKELCEKLYKSGLRLVQFGFESANENTCKIINKGIDYNKRLKTIKMFADAGIFTYLFAILGFPTEAREDGIKTINIIQDNPDIIDFLFIHQFWLDKKSIAYKKYKQIGIEKIIEDKNNPFSQKYDFEAINKEYTSNLNEIFKLYKEQRCDKKYNFFAPDEYFFLYAIHYGRKNLKEILK